MSLQHPYLFRFLAFALSLAAPLKAVAQVDLLEPIGEMNQINTDNPNFFFTYVDVVYPWMMGVAAGIAVLWGVWGGFGIILSGGDQAKVTEGKNQVIAAVTGLLILLFAATILRTINPTFFTFAS